MLLLGENIIITFAHVPMTNQEIIPPVPVHLLEAELTPDRLLRVSNRAGNEIYVVDGREAPNVMREI